MRESVGSTWTIQAVIFFILIFSAFLSLVIQYSRAYIVKNEVLSIIEKYEGARSSREIMINYVKNQGYKTKAVCPEADEAESKWYGLENYESNFEEAVKGKKYLFCIQQHEVVVDKTNALVGNNETVRKVYYNVIFFYRFNLPILGELHTYRVTGETKSFIGADKRLLD